MGINGERWHNPNEGGDLLGLRLEAVGLASKARNMKSMGKISDEQKAGLRSQVEALKYDLSQIDAASSEQARKDTEAALAEVLEIIL